MKPGKFLFQRTFKEYRFERNRNYDHSLLSKEDKSQQKQFKMNTQAVLKDQEKGREWHIKNQQPEVRERMKKSFEESEKTRGRKNLWERLKSWIKNERVKQKKF